MPKSKILRLKLPDIAQHLGLGVMLVKNRVREEFRLSRKWLGQQRLRMTSQMGDAERPVAIILEDTQQMFEVFTRRRLVEGHRHRVRVDITQVDAVFLRKLDQVPGASIAQANVQGVEIDVI